MLITQIHHTVMKPIFDTIITSSVYISKIYMIDFCQSKLFAGSWTVQLEPASFNKWKLLKESTDS